MHRDALFTMCGDHIIVITTDNAAGIGERADDIVNVDPYYVGRLTARVALFESISLGSVPVGISTTLSFAHTDTSGNQILKGILDEVLNVGLTEKEMTGSSETNFPVSVTCVGVTVVAVAQPGKMLLNRVEAGHRCYVVGEPLIGLEVIEKCESMISMFDLKRMSSLNPVSEIVPVGSRGIKSELDGLCNSYSLGFSSRHNLQIDCKRSAGPATCILVIGDVDELMLQKFTKSKITYLGYFKEVD